MPPEVFIFQPSRSQLVKGVVPFPFGLLVWFFSHRNEHVERGTFYSWFSSQEFKIDVLYNNSIWVLPQQPRCSYDWHFGYISYLFKDSWVLHFKNIQIFNSLFYFRKTTLKTMLLNTFQKIIFRNLILKEEQSYYHERVTIIILYSGCSFTHYIN